MQFFQTALNLNLTSLQIYIPLQQMKLIYIIWFIYKYISICVTSIHNSFLKKGRKVITLKGSFLQRYTIYVNTIFLWCDTSDNDHFTETFCFCSNQNCITILFFKVSIIDQKVWNSLITKRDKTQGWINIFIAFNIHSNGQQIISI